MISDARKEYGDIIDLQHHVSEVHPQMSRLNRAAQFSPFAALTGYEDLIDEAARRTESQIELDESEKEEISRKLNTLLALDEPQEVRISYFVQDGKKTGGSYETASGCITAYREFARAVILDSGISIPIDDIVSISSDYFDRDHKRT